MASCKTPVSIITGFLGSGKPIIFVCKATLLCARSGVQD